MYCRNCKREIKEGKFCPYCGKKQVLENGNECSRTDKSSPKDKKKLNVKVILGLVCIIVILGLINRKKLPELNTEQIIAGMSESGANAVYLGENMFFLGIDSLEVLEKEINKDEIMSVTCDVIMSDDVMSAKAQYNLVYVLQEDYWILEDYIMNNLEYVKPKQGVDESIVYGMVDFVSILCDGDEEKIELLQSHINTTLALEIKERDTDLDNGTDAFLVAYKYQTYTKENEGEIFVEYMFENGQWIINNTLHFPNSSKWMLEGKWDFDIYTYYVEVIIRSIDWSMMEAQVEYKGSIWHGGGEVHSATVGLIKSGEWLCFTPLVVPADNYMSDDRYIMLWAKEDDMYYEAPSWFIREPPVHLPVGGRAQ